MGIEGTFICNHCGERKPISHVNPHGEEYDIVYIPKSWVGIGSNRHLCNKCHKVFIKNTQTFMRSHRQEKV